MLDRKGRPARQFQKIPLNLVLLKGCELVGVYWGRHARQNPGAFRQQISRLLAWGAEGAIRPHIDHVLPLEQTAEALRMMERRQIKGKVIVKP